MLCGENHLEQLWKLIHAMQIAQQNGNCIKHSKKKNYKKRKKSFGHSNYVHFSSKLVADQIN